MDVRIGDYVALERYREGRSQVIGGVVEWFGDPLNMRLSGFGPCGLAKSDPGIYFVRRGDQVWRAGAWTVEPF